MHLEENFLDPTAEHYLYTNWCFGVCLILNLRSTEGLSNPPKLRRNVSASANISNLASQSVITNPGFLDFTGFPKKQVKFFSFFVALFCFSMDLSFSALPKCTSSWSFDEKLLIQSLYKVIMVKSSWFLIWFYPQSNKVAFNSIHLLVVFRFWCMYQKPAPWFYTFGMWTSSCSGLREYTTFSRRCSINFLVQFLSLAHGYWTQEMTMGR